MLIGLKPIDYSSLSWKNKIELDMKWPNEFAEISDPNYLMSGYYCFKTEKGKGRLLQIHNRFFVVAATSSSH